MENAILIKNLYVTKRYGTQRLLSKFPDSRWKLGSTDSLLQDGSVGYICPSTR